VFTYNGRDFEVLHKAYLNEGRRHWGMLIGQQNRNLRVTATRVASRLSDLRPEDLRDQLLYV